MKVDCVLAYHLPEPYVYEAIKSVLWQRHEDFHLHVVDDTGGNGINEELRKAFPDLRITFYRNPKNIGFYQSVNEVFWNFKGELFFIFDSDDISPNWRIEDAVNLYQKESFDIYTAGIQWLEENSAISDSYTRSSPIVLDKFGNISDGRFHNPCAAIRCEFFKDINGYSDCKVGGDRDFVIKSICFGAKFCYDSERVMAYRRKHPKQVTKAADTGMDSCMRKQIHSDTSKRSQKYYLGKVKARIKKCGRLQLTRKDAVILI